MNSFSSSNQQNTGGGAVYRKVGGTALLTGSGPHPSTMNIADPSVSARTDVSSAVPTTPYIRIVEQPAPKALRFRYECEGRSAGSIPGVNSTPENKSYPTIQIVGYRGRAVVVVSCVTKDPPYRPHPHNLVGKEGCKKGICTLEVNNEGMVASFSNLGIQCVKKKDIEEALRTREEIRVDPFRTGFSHRNQPNSIDLNAVRLCFQAFLDGSERGKFDVLTPVVSDPIYDKKAMSDLVICKLSDTSAPVIGGKEIILLCEKVAKDDIQVRFFEESVDGSQVLWEGYGDFTPTQVHKQVAIYFRTPRYKSLQVDKLVNASIQLKRPSDGAASDPVPFMFTPLDTDPLYMKRKRQRYSAAPDSSSLLKHLQQHFSSSSPSTDIGAGNKMMTSPAGYEKELHPQQFQNVTTNSGSPFNAIGGSGSVQGADTLDIGSIMEKSSPMYGRTHLPSPSPPSPVVISSSSSASPSPIMMQQQQHASYYREQQQQQLIAQNRMFSPTVSSPSLYPKDSSVATHMSGGGIMLSPFFSNTSAVTSPYHHQQMPSAAQLSVAHSPAGQEMNTHILAPGNMMGAVLRQQSALGNSAALFSGIENNYHAQQQQHLFGGSNLAKMDDLLMEPKHEPGLDCIMVDDDDLRLNSLTRLDSKDLAAELSLLDAAAGNLSENLSSCLTLSEETKCKIDQDEEQDRSMTDSLTKLANRTVDELCSLNQMYHHHHNNGD